MFREGGAESWPTEEDAEELAEVEDVIEGVETNLEDIVDLTDSHRHMLAEIFDKARGSFDKDPAEWQALFKSLETALGGDLDHDEIVDLINQYRRKATALAQ